MPLAAHTQFGAYEIIAPIGAGGMGEVYRAKDIKLNREVAIKVLPAALANDAQYMARFEREAQMLAALNHPNIATVYGIEQGALVMELVEGDNLRGPLRLDVAIPIARQIALGLEAAHERGIIHRDLKPANIRITPEGVVKLLDFGLAKSTVDAAASTRGSNPTISPTLSLEMTQAGMIMGTAAYMSPEQARGKSVDRRADIWAFGVVLYEMLTGKKLFEGETVSDILAAVLKEEPDLTSAPVEGQRLLRSCLKRDPRQRLHDIADAMLLLDDVPALASKKRLWLWPSIAAGLAIALAAAALVAFRQPPPPAPVSMQFQIPAPENTQFTAQMALSPDGRMLAFTAASDGINSIWVRPLDALQARPLLQARTNQPFFWSPDSRFIAYNNGDQKLTKIDVTGGPPQVVCDAPNGVIGGFWTKDDRIVFGQTPGPLMSVSASGGVPTPFAALDSSRGITTQVLPSLLPDGRHLIFYTSVSSKNGVSLTSFGAEPGSAKFLVDAPVAASFAPSADSTSGHLLFMRDSTLVAQPFDLTNLALAGTAVPVAEGVGTSLAHGFFSVSKNGVLAYRTGPSGGLRLAWLDRTGKETGSVGPPGDYRALALSPDGARVATSRMEARNLDIWLFDLERNTNTRLTSDPAADNAPVWSRDGSRIAWVSGAALAGNNQGLFMTLTAGDAKPEMLLPPTPAQVPWDWSGDGRLLLYAAADAKTGKRHLWTVAVDGERKPVQITQTEFNETQAQFSPDGRWISYVSNESGRNEIYVRPFPASPEQGGKIKLSEGGGTSARWRRDGKELFYIASDTKMMAIDVRTAPSFKAGVPQPLFQTRILPGTGSFMWDASADGKRFLIATVAAEKSDAITIVTNWQATLRK